MPRLLTLNPGITRPFYQAPPVWIEEKSKVRALKGDPSTAESKFGVSGKHRREIGTKRKQKSKLVF